MLSKTYIHPPETFNMKLKGQLGQLPTIAMALVMFMIFAGLGVLILAGMNDSTTNTDAQGVFESGITSLSDLVGWAPVIVVVVAAVVIISLLGYFRSSGRV